MHTWESMSISTHSPRPGRESDNSGSQSSRPSHRVSQFDDQEPTSQDSTELQLLKPLRYGSGSFLSRELEDYTNSAETFDSRANLIARRGEPTESGVSSLQDDSTPLRIDTQVRPSEDLRPRLPVYSPVSPPDPGAGVQVNVIEPTPSTSNTYPQSSFSSDSEDDPPPVPPLPPPDQIPPLRTPTRPRKAGPPSAAAQAIAAIEQELWERKQNRAASFVTEESHQATDIGRESSTRNHSEKPLPELPQIPRRMYSRRVSRGRSRTPRSVQRISMLSATPTDLLVPPPLFTRHGNNQREIISRALGQTAGPRLSSRQPSEDRAQLKSIRRADPRAPPDGGPFAWSLAVCGFCGTFTAWGLAWIFGVFAAWYKTVMIPEESLANISWIGSLQLFLLFFLGQLVGFGMDRGVFRPFSVGGTVLVVAGMLATSSCTKWWQLLLAQGLTTGLGMGLVFSSGVLCLMQYFERNLGKAMALAATGSCLGAIVYTLIFIRLVTKIGFPWTVRVMALVAGLTLLPFAILMRQREGAAGTQQKGREVKTRPKMNLKVFLDRPYLVMTAGFFFAFWSLYFTVAYMVLYGIQVLQIPGERAANILIAMSATNLIGRLLPGVISDACTGPLNLVIPSCVISAIFSAVWIWSTTEGALIAVASFYGFSSGGIQALFSPAMHSFSMDDHENMHAKGGLFLTVVSFGALTGSPIGGKLVGDFGQKGYLGAQLFSSCSMLLAAILLIAARYMRIGWQPQRA